ncbi:uncharacterized protein LOC134796835 [Cydia splendana]|uniref:uncharacterized protein LOC134796835 n=1 Tax=Cydia splendana TaxID=1100963 RepID=UPI00300D9485
MGCLIWGYLELAGVAYQLIRFILLCKDFGQVIQFLKQFLKMTNETEQVIRSVGIGLLIFSCILFAIKVFFNIVFLRGLHMNIRAHVGAYLLYTFVFIIVTFITCIVITAEVGTMEQLRMPGTVTAIMVVLIILLHVLILYFWLVIRSQYCLMDIKPQTNLAVEFRNRS